MSEKEKMCDKTGHNINFSIFYPLPLSGLCKRAPPCPAVLPRDLLRSAAAAAFAATAHK